MVEYGHHLCHEGRKSKDRGITYIFILELITLVETMRTRVTISAMWRDYVSGSGNRYHILSEASSGD